MADTWRSPTRGKKATWTRDTTEKMASAVWEALPSKLRALLQDETYKGAPLIALKDDVGWKIVASDLGANKIMLTPILTQMPDKTPSTFLLADVLLHVHHEISNEKLL